MKPEWLYDGDIDPSQFSGFVYRITNLVTGKAYIGRKYTWKTTAGKRSESNWRTYWGSSADLKADIKSLGHDQFEREILHWCKTKQLTNYLETAEQFKQDVLTAKLPNGRPAFYNLNILGRYYARTIAS